MGRTNQPKKADLIWCDSGSIFVTNFPVRKVTVSPMRAMTILCGKLVITKKVQSGDR